MLARPIKRQKPCSALSFQNAEQGFSNERLFIPTNYGFVGVAVAGAAAAAGGAAAPPLSFGVAR